jgi:hypothetical protein
MQGYLAGKSLEIEEAAVAQSVNNSCFYRHGHIAPPKHYTQYTFTFNYSPYFFLKGQ